MEKEYIVPIEEDQCAWNEIFVGEIISGKELIRCKDCKYYGRLDKRRFCRGYDCLQGRMASIVPDKDYCSRAERKEE